MWRHLSKSGASSMAKANGLNPDWTKKTPNSMLWKVRVTHLVVLVSRQGLLPVDRMAVSNNHESWVRAQGNTYQQINSLMCLFTLGVHRCASSTSLPPPTAEFFSFYCVEFPQLPVDRDLGFWLCIIQCATFVPWFVYFVGKSQLSCRPHSRAKSEVCRKLICTWTASFLTAFTLCIYFFRMIS